MGTFGDLATVSFYPAHHITMGEGGCVLTDKPLLKTLVESFRDWGRDCWCDPGKDNTCGKRFDWQLGDLPCGYDHKYTYSHIGYNLKLTDMQAAVGVAQLQKLPGFIETRRAQLSRLCTKGCATCEEFFILPEATAGSEPSWFGFPIAVRAGRAVHAQPGRSQAPGTAQDRHAPAVWRQPGAPAGLQRHPRIACAATSRTPTSSMNQVFWIGVYPGITPAMLDYVLESFHAIAHGRRNPPDPL